MEPTDFPSNSFSNQDRDREPRVQKVIKGEAKTQKKSFRKQIFSTFLEGDIKSALRFAMIEVFLPETRSAVHSVFVGFVDKLFLGDSRRSRGASIPVHDPRTGLVEYNRLYGGAGGILANSARAATRVHRGHTHDYTQITLDSRRDAEEVLSSLFEVVNTYNEASVADLYELVGLASNHQDLRWGWKDLQGARVNRVDNGFVLDLPSAVPIG